MHTHLVTFRVVGRTPFDAKAYEEANEGEHGVPGGIDPTPFATGPIEPAAPEERGFKDTVKAKPRLLHDHMMRPFTVTLAGRSHRTSTRRLLAQQLPCANARPRWSRVPHERLSTTRSATRRRRRRARSRST
jgi:hypothetical protein